MFCKHNWEILSETVTKSKFQHAIEIAGRGKGIMPHQMACAERKHIQLVTFKKCGKLKRFVEKI